MFHKDKKYGCVTSQAEALKLLDVFAHVEARLLRPSLRVLLKSGADAEQWCGLKMIWSLCTMAKMVMSEGSCGDGDVSFSVGSRCCSGRYER